MDFEEKTVDTKYIHKGRIINLRIDNVLAPNGKSAIREIIEHNGGSAILCVENKKVLLIKQFRYAYKEVIWEIPAGKLNEGEDPKNTAIRELEEECGYKAGSVKEIFKVYPSPGYTNEVIRIYKAEGLVKTKTSFDEDEFIESKWIDLKSAKEMVYSGEIFDAKTVIALLYAINGESEQ